MQHHIQCHAEFRNFGKKNLSQRQPCNKKFLLALRPKTPQFLSTQPPFFFALKIQTLIEDSFYLHQFPNGITLRTSVRICTLLYHQLNYYTKIFGCADLAFHFLLIHLFVCLFVLFTCDYFFYYFGLIYKQFQYRHNVTANQTHNLSHHTIFSPTTTSDNHHILVVL